MTNDNSIYPPIPVLSPDEDLANTLGCLEMEQTALYLLRRIIATKDWELRIDYEDFGRDKLLGFIMLAAHGWLEPDSPNGMFIVRPEFAWRIHKKLPIKRTRRHLVRT